MRYRMKNYSNKILITGGDSQLANAIYYHPLAKQYKLILRKHHECDITNPTSILENIKNIQPHYIINTAAYTAVDKAEQEIDKAMLVNCEGPKQLAIACKQYAIPLIHISTDYIFDGHKRAAYLEHDVVNPLNIYGKSKWLGEEAIREHCEQHIILRASAVFSEYGNNFLKTMLRLAKEKTTWQVVNDQITCPTYAGDIAYALFKLIEQYEAASGTYHFCSSDSISWYNFASHILYEAKKYSPLQVKEIQPITTKDYQTLAKRPLYSVLKCEKIFTDFKLSQPTWQAHLPLIIEQFFR